MSNYACIFASCSSSKGMRLLSYKSGLVNTCSCGVLAKTAQLFQTLLKISAHLVYTR